LIRLANEVFLTIKRAYDQLSSNSAVPRPGLVATGTGAQQIRAAGTGAPPSRAPTAPGPAVPPAAATPPAARPKPATPAPRPTPPRAQTVPGTPAPVPGTMRPSGAIPKVSFNGAAPPAAAKSTAPATSGPEVELEAALDLMRRKLWGEARQAFQKLAISSPHEKRYRAYMHLARAREAHDAGKVDEARAEVQRALALDPDLPPAKRLLDDLPPEPSGGLFKKIFKR
jgi:hypothetical protein